MWDWRAALNDPLRYFYILRFYILRFCGLFYFKTCFTRAPASFNKIADFTFNPDSSMIFDLFRSTTGTL